MTSKTDSCVNDKVVSDKDSSQSDSDDDKMNLIRQYLASKLNLGGSNENKKVIEDLSFNGLIEHFKNKRFKNVITLVGAGISTSAGIPDFRSPGSGLYDNLSKYNLPSPMAIFDLSYFYHNPRPFFVLAKELYPGLFKPTPSHYFLRLLHEKGVLIRHYSQNIDTLERMAGIPEEVLVEAHGTFHLSHCIKCRKQYTLEWMKEKIFADQVPICTRCKNTVKPDIVFFGENLPDKFYTLPQADFKKCELLIIMGTSLEVFPFAGLVDNVRPDCLRLLINRDEVGDTLLFNRPKNTRDIAYIGECDKGVFDLADGLGWGDDLRELIIKEQGSLDYQTVVVNTDSEKLKFKKESGQKLKNKRKEEKNDKKQNQNVTRDDQKETNQTKSEENDKSSISSDSDAQNMPSTIVEKQKL